MEITEQNIEELILLYIDGELDTATTGAVLEYAGRHPKYAAMLEDYQQAVLPQDTGIVYPDKKGLLREESTAVPFRKKRKWQFSIAAAAVLLLLSVFAVKYTFQNSRGMQEAGKIAKSHTGPAQIAPAPPSVPAIVKSPAGATRTPVRQSKRNKPAEKMQTGAPENGVTGEKKQAEIPRLPSQEIIQVPQEIRLNTTTVAIALPKVETPEPTGPELPEWLPVRKEKIDVVNELVAQFKEVKERFEEGGRTLKNASFALRIGDKEIGFGKKNHN